MTKRVLLTMAKRPAAGQTKTRLAEALSPDQAADLYACFLKDTLVLMQQVANQIDDVQLVIAYAPPEDEAYFANLAPEFSLIAQQGPDLSERLALLAAHYFDQGVEQLVMMNSDSPTLPVAHIVAAFTGLSQGADVTLGPCDDGGYYAIGLQQPVLSLFRDVQMSTDQVVADTMTKAEANGLTVSLLPAWYDVDDAASLQRLRQEVDRPESEAAFYTRAYLSQSLG